VPTLIVAADADMAHHYNIFSSPLFGAVTLAFLDQQPG